MLHNLPSLQTCGGSEEILGGVHGRDRRQQRPLRPALCFPPAQADTAREVAPKGFKVSQLYLIIWGLTLTANIIQPR